MRNLLLVFLALATLTSSAQTDNEPAYKRFPTVPPLSLLSPDSTTFSKDNLSKNKPTIIMYFNPLCDHCQHQMEDMIRRMDEFAGIQIVLATYAPMNELTDFIAKYNLAKYPNISSGRDTKYMLQPFYKMTGLPYQALYDAKGNLVTTYEGNVKIDTVLNSLKKKD
jgi:cytochrome oxidase Cu insertion factor (SCO1/SenC/PrrC family)